MLGGIVAQLRHPRQSSCLALASHSTTTFDRLRKMFNRSKLPDSLSNVSTDACKPWLSKCASHGCTDKKKRIVGRDEKNAPSIVASQLLACGTSWKNVFLEAKTHVSIFKCACWRLVLHNGGQSLILVRTAREWETEKKVTSNRQSFKSVTGICLFVDSDFFLWEKEGGSSVTLWSSSLAVEHVKSKRHLQYRMCPPSHAPSHANSTLFSQTRVWQQHCRLCQTSHATSLHMLLFVTARSVPRRIFATIALCLSNLHQFILESQAAVVITTLERSRHATVVTSDGGAKLPSTQCPSKWQRLCETQICDKILLILRGRLSHTRQRIQTTARQSESSRVTVECVFCGCAKTSRSFFDGGFSLIQVRTVRDLERNKTSPATDSLLVPALCKRRNPDHCTSSRKRHLWYRMRAQFFQNSMRQPRCRVCVYHHTQHLSTLPLFLKVCLLASGTP